MAGNFDKEMTLVRAYVAGWFTRRGLIARDAFTKPYLFSSMFLDYSELPKSVDDGTKKTRFRVFSEKELRHAFDEHVEKNLIEDLPRSVQPLLFTGALDEQNSVEVWTKAVIGTDDSNSVAVMKHWLWMIKRKALNLPIKYQVMPVVHGEQQGGKSTAIRKLLEPLKDYTLNMKFDKLLDERVYKGFAYNLIVFVDEMQGIEKADLNALKNQITADSNAYRQLYSHATITVPMACSFIGSTNRHLNEMLSDATGMRRFFEVKASKVLDWTSINSLDYSKVWQQIDETSSEGYLTGQALAEVNQQQKSLVLDEDVDLFIKECAVRPSVEHKLLSASCLFRGYRDWSIEAGVRYPFSRSHFVNKLKNRDMVHEKIKEVLYFRVGLSCTVRENSDKVKLVAGGN